MPIVEDLLRLEPMQGARKQYRHAPGRRIGPDHLRELGRDALGRDMLFPHFDEREQMTVAGAGRKHPTNGRHDIGRVPPCDVNVLIAAEQQPQELAVRIGMDRVGRTYHDADPGTAGRRFVRPDLDIST
ncbi:hypothetical protein [Sphingomonas sp. MMO-176]|uniref:hypothetical protein n=1 Tax=Sphingomonas sp. MMO-176 TaxID=3081299 RepID=UPI0030787ACE